MSKPILSQEYLKTILNYDPATGAFTWIIRKRGISKKEAGSISGRGYKTLMINKYNYTASRLAWIMHYGVQPDGQVDHINHDRSDNKIENLRVVTNQQNQMNRRYTGNSSGVIGVCLVKKDGRWKSHIKVDGRLINLGEYKDIEEAISIRLCAEDHYGFHRNHGAII
jgi:hypothetical protein